MADTHTLNAFEDGDNLVMDFIGFPDNAIFYGVGLELMIDNPRDYMHTWGACFVMIELIQIG